MEQYNFAIEHARELQITLWVIFCIVTVYTLTMPFLIWLELRRMNDKLEGRLMQERFREEREERHLKATMSKEETRQIIAEALEKAKYGPR